MSAQSQHMQAIIDAGRKRATTPTPPPPSAPAPEPDRTAGRSVNWQTLEQLQAPTEWTALRQFVEWVTVRYEISASVVPDCWWRHPPLVEELSALHSAHLAAFDPADTRYGPISWHERLAGAYQRLARAYHGGCSSGHNSIRPRPGSTATDEQEWDAWITQTHAH